MTLAGTGGDPFSILGITETATEEEIERAFRKLAKLHHPDVSSAADAAATFARLKEARDQLVDPARRRAAQAARSAAKPARMSDAFEGIFESFGAMERNRDTPYRRSARGADVERTVSITLEQAYSGFKGRLGDSPGPCVPCSGTGRVACEPRPCPDCVGRGKLRKSRGLITLDIECPPCQGTGRVTVAQCTACGGSGQVQGGGASFEVPPGAREGMGIIVKGMGAPGSGGGASGDLVISLRIKPHATFTRQDGDLAMSVEIPVWDAAAGCVVPVTGIDGRSLGIDVPPGTGGGREVVLQGQGMPSFPGRGVLRVRIDVMVPVVDGPEVAEAYAALRRAAGAVTSSSVAGSGR